MNAYKPTWSRKILPCTDLGSFLHAFRIGFFDDVCDEAPAASWLADDAPCMGDELNPLLAAPGHRRRSLLLAGEIRDGRGYHPAAVFRDDASEGS